MIDSWSFLRLLKSTAAAGVGPSSSSLLLLSELEINSSSFVRILRVSLLLWCESNALCCAVLRCAASRGEGETRLPKSGCGRADDGGSIKRWTRIRLIFNWTIPEGLYFTEKCFTDTSTKRDSILFPTRRCEFSGSTAAPFSSCMLACLLAFTIN